ncbi:hypothetical protein ES332_D08G168500v1 [Gossypium tomentosum]|uniref:Uncharacterized protein n=1 Tax=Gossypium tomentosum TaxID=34277 RepID=A0A5D2JW06_GOSTO|nr:hypothetical protein ES332_D08G168500v1 [Gossypium tomentosum]
MKMLKKKKKPKTNIKNTCSWRDTGWKKIKKNLETRLMLADDDDDDDNDPFGFFYREDENNCPNPVLKTVV